jgi:hypothetical protein
VSSSDKEKVRITIQAVIDKESARAVNRFKADAPGILKQYHKESRHLERDIQRTWSKPLHLLETFIGISQEVGAKFNLEEGPRAERRRDYTFLILVRLHGRSCRIAREILLLLKSGYPAGAYARWRALHEVAVIDRLVTMNGNDLAERYINHEVIERINGMRVNQQYHERIGMDPYSETEIANATQTETKLIHRYGEKFKRDYGWAASILGKKDATFRELEKLAGLDHLRPYYKLASDDIHAGARILRTNIGVIGAQRDIILAGPTDAGLSLPGQNTVISLMHVNTCTLSVRPDMENVVLSGSLLELCHEACLAFADAEARQEERLRTHTQLHIKSPTFRFIKPPK